MAAVVCRLHQDCAFVVLFFGLCGCAGPPIGSDQSDGGMTERTADGGGSGGAGSSGGMGGNGGARDGGSIPDRPPLDRVPETPVDRSPDVLSPGACVTNDQCPPTHYCGRPTGRCHVNDALCRKGADVYCLTTPGVCRPRPSACTQDRDSHAICGCDAMIYLNACLLQQAGTGLATYGDPNACL